MTYTSISFYFFLAAALAAYYLMPVSVRWVALLGGSGAFYFLAYKTGGWILLMQIFFTYGAGICIERLGRRKEGQADTAFCGRKKAVFILSLCGTAFPWLCMKNGDFVLGSIFHRPSYPWIIPLGVSFYTLQMVSYLADIYKGTARAQKNPLKYALFILFFPQIVQGPIPRYGDLAGQLYEGHLFQEKEFSRGFQKILWGFFLKLMIADKAAVVVNEIFAHPYAYTGCYVFVAGALYSVELYADFMACTQICKGVAGLFGLNLADNFMRPYLSVSVKEFWRRWHISLSGWLRDYVYIPLGGGRRGRYVKYRNLLFTFAVSGVWHGAGYKFLFWGLLHGLYQIVGDITADVKQKIYARFGLPEGSAARGLIQKAGVFFWVMLAWIIFRADSLTVGLTMVGSLFFVHNPWIFFNDSLLLLGLGWKEWGVLLISIGVLWFVGRRQEHGARIGESVLQMPIYLRWAVYIAAVVVIMVFGTYGFGFDAQAFIYSGF